MEFIFECEDLDGLVLIDEEYLNELDEEILYAFDICLDREGKSELVYDFPNKEWCEVYNEATTVLEKFCNSGKMIVFLAKKNNYDCVIDFCGEIIETNSFLHVKSGKLVLVNAGELIQCASYKDLEMEKILEIDNIDKGIYAVKNNDICNIILKRCNDLPSQIKNIVLL